MNYALYSNHQDAGEGEMKEEEHTLVKVRHGCFALFGVLELCILFVSIVSLDVIPCIKFEDIILLVEEARAKLKGIAPLEVCLRVVGKMWWDLSG
jgi:hypothetical protein